MNRSDRWTGLALAVLGAAVLWSARDFPVVPGQRFGAAFLPQIVGVGLMLCAVVLIWRGWRAGRTAAVGAGDGGNGGNGGDVGGDAGQLPREEHFGSSAVILAVIVGYILFADRVGFLIVAPLALIATFKALRVGWLPAVLWAVGGTAVVHLAFYKLLRVPLPWGVLTPFY